MTKQEAPNQEHNPGEGMTNDYTLTSIERVVSERIQELTGTDMTFLLHPVPRHLGADYGVQLTTVAKRGGLNPNELAEQVAANISSNLPDFLERAEPHGAYLNVRLEMGRFASETIAQILRMGTDYGKEDMGQRRVVVVDMSSPNIAKRMSYGHLRSTIIGDAISNIYEVMGFEVIRDNHIGDWGTQFGKLIAALKRWGDEQEIITSEDPLELLQELYVKFHDEAERQALDMKREYKDRVAKDGLESIPELAETVEIISQEIMARKKIGREQLNMETILEATLDRVVVTQLEREGREWFLHLEQGDPEARRLWQLCVDLSMQEFEKLYEILGVKFDVVYGESFYEDMLTDTIREAKESGAGQISEGALVVDMRDRKLGVAVVQKSDGASVYMTRDLAAAIYREKEMKADRAIYVVGADQQLYFRQLFEILKTMGHGIGQHSVHVYFGMVSLPEGRMSTRKGRVILLKDVVDEGQRRAEITLQKKNPSLYADENLRRKIARQISVGAMKWNDLSEDPRRNIVFDWDVALSMEGYSASYVQYAAVRANNIVERSGITIEQLKDGKVQYETEGQIEEAERGLIRLLAEYPGILKEALATNLATKVARYTYELAQAFNIFYDRVNVLKAGKLELVESRVRLVAATSQVLSNSLHLLGIEVPEAM